MIENDIEVNEGREIVNVPYHDFTIEELRISKDEATIFLKSIEGETLTKLHAIKPIQYNITGIFPDSIVGEAFLFDLQELLDDHGLIGFARHVIGGRLREQHVYDFLERINRDERQKLLLIETIDGGKISVVAPEVTGATNL